MLDPRHLIGEMISGWFKAQSMNPYGAFHLYYKPAPNAELAVCEEAPEGYQLGSPERISPAWDAEKAEYMVRQWTRRLPILG